MNATFTILTIVVLFNLCICIVSCFALWRMRKRAGRLGLHILSVLVATVVSSGFTIWARQDIKGMVLPPQYELKRLVGAAIFSLAQTALCLYLLFPKEKVVVVKKDDPAGK